MHTLLYDVHLVNPVSNQLYPETFVDLRNLVGMTPGSLYYIRVTANFASIPMKDGREAKMVEIDVAVDGEFLGWVYDVTPAVPTCTFEGFRDAATGAVKVFTVERTIETLEGGDGYEDDLGKIQIYATVIYDFDDTGLDEDADGLDNELLNDGSGTSRIIKKDGGSLLEKASLRSTGGVYTGSAINFAGSRDLALTDFFEFPVTTLHYHTPGTIQLLQAKERIKLKSILAGMQQQQSQSHSSSSSSHHLTNDVNQGYYDHHSSSDPTTATAAATSSNFSGGFSQKRVRVERHPYDFEDYSDSEDEDGVVDLVGHLPPAKRLHQPPLLPAGQLLVVDVEENTEEILVLPSVVNNVTLDLTADNAHNVHTNRNGTSHSRG